MPFLSGGLVLAPQMPAPDELVRARAAVSEPVGAVTISWIDPDGTEWPLSNTDEALGWFVMNGPSGWGATPIEITSDSLPRGGEQVRYIRAKPRRMNLPVYIGGPTQPVFLDRYRRLSYAFTKTTVRAAPGQLKVARADGTFRLIDAYYEDGLGGEAEQNFLWAKPVITLYCPDGYWSDGTPVRAIREFGPAVTTPVSFFAPFINIVSSRAVGATSTSTGDSDGSSGAEPEADDIVNSGDVEAWPTWTITGPMTVMRAFNSTLQSRFALTYPLLAGQTITITTNPATVRGPGDVSLSRYVDWFNPAGTELWPLLSGVNDVQFEMDGADDGSAVELTFTPRFDNS